jgi:hypothetical protein
MDRTDVGVVESDTASHISPESEFFGVYAKSGDDGGRITRLEERYGPIASDGRESA